jgi:hypothetical protein
MEEGSEKKRDVRKTGQDWRRTDKVQEWADRDSCRLHAKVNPQVWK